MAKIANLAPTWRPKKLQNRAQSEKKPMLKNDAFLASILGGLGHRFGMVLERFFEPKTHSESENLNGVKT